MLTTSTRDATNKTSFALSLLCRVPLVVLQLAGINQDDGQNVGSFARDPVEVGTMRTGSRMRDDDEEGDKTTGK